MEFRYQPLIREPPDLAQTTGVEPAQPCFRLDGLAIHSDTITACLLKHFGRTITL